MSERYTGYTPQYLGRSGMTQRCVDAMAAVLTSAFRPEKITIVIGTWKQTHLVLFLVWDWLSSEMTIIPDGFGTHGGEGGAGLSTVLGLIKFYNIPLLQTWIDDRETFQELAQGHLTEETFDKIQEAVAYDWNFYRVFEAQKVKIGEQQFLQVRDPREKGSHANLELDLLLP